MNILICSIGRRVELVKNIKKTLGEDSIIIWADASNTAPGLFYCDRYYIVPGIISEQYIDRIIEICIIENIKVLLTLIDPEIEILAGNKERFNSIGVTVLVPSVETAELCYDKYKMFEFLKNKNIPTVETYKNIEEFLSVREARGIDFPVFVKPRKGSGSVGAEKIETLEELEYITRIKKDLIIQEYMSGEDIDVDVYVDLISRKPVSMFAKKKIEVRIGGANKTISFVDTRLFEAVNTIVRHFDFYGPVDMDFFYKNGNYYLSEINPRFGGAYIHAHGCGINFISMIRNNMCGKENNTILGNYESGVYMLMYDCAVLTKNCNNEV